MASTGYNDGTVLYDAAILYNGAVVPDPPVPVPTADPLVPPMSAYHPKFPTRYALPEIESGYALDPGIGLFSVILPLGADKTNLVANPSVETGTTGYSVNIGGAVARDSTVQKFGVYSLKCTPSSAVTDGWKYDTVSLVAGTQYVASVWFKGQAGLKYRLDFLTTGGIGVGSPTRFVATGFWQRVSLTYLETSTTTRRVYVRKDDQTNVTPFWTDGLQVEADQLTTYIDGDRTGFVRNRADYYWTGTPHASTSVRIGQSRSGGKVISLNDLGFRLLSVLGLGMGGIINQLTPLARGGAYYGGTVFADRQFSLVGQIDDASGYLQLARKRQALVDLFRPDIVSPVQPVVLRYTPTDDCGNQAGNEQEIVCAFQDGMSGRTDNLNAERLGLQFQLYLPFVMQEVGNAAKVLDTQDSIAINYTAARTPAGQWGNMAGGCPGIVNGQAVVGPDNRVYFPAQDGIYAWNPVTGAWSTIGTATGGVVNAIVFDAEGQMYAGGTFTDMNGVANTDSIALATSVTTPTWVSISSSFTGSSIMALAVQYFGTISSPPTARIIVGGNFSNIDGVALDDIGYYTRSSDTWTNIDGPNFVKSLVNAPDGYIYAFATDKVERFRFPFTSWEDLITVTGGGADADVGVFDPAGNLYIAGLFDTVALSATPSDTIAASNIVLFNGSGLSPLGAGTSGVVDVVSFGPVSGVLYAAGGFAAAGGETMPDRMAQWNGAVWQSIDINLAGSSRILSIRETVDGTLYVGYADTGTALVAGVTTITNGGSVEAGPRFAFTGPGTVYPLRNPATGKAIRMNLVLLAGETAVLDLTDPSNITFRSNVRGNLLGNIMPGSQLSDFKLAPGNNSITLFIGGVTGAATLGTAAWRSTYHSLDGAIPGRLLP